MLGVWMPGVWMPPVAAMDAAGGDAAGGGTGNNNRFRHLGNSILQLHLLDLSAQMLDLSAQTAVQHPKLARSVARLVRGEPVRQVGDVLGFAIGAHRMYIPRRLFE